jgi:predicted SnoaL-like aldol condensation-catalyzing enzyme
MKIKYLQIKLISGLILLNFTNFAVAQVETVQTTGQKTWLYSEDPKLSHNKKIVYDFWREILESGHIDLASRYLTETYIQHNPNVPSGRQGFVDLFKNSQPQPIVDSIRSPLIAIVAEGNLVVLVFTIELPDPNDPSKKYSTSSFDMFRIEGDKIAEHWDGERK